MSFRIEEPPYQSFKDFTLPHFQTKQLKNRQYVHFLKCSTQDMIFLHIIFKAGSWQEHEKHSSSLLSTMFFEGTRKKTSYQIKEFFDMYGATCYANASKHHFTIELCCLNKYLDSILNQLTNILQDNIFPSKNWEREKEILLDDLKYQEERTDYLAKRNFFQKFYGAQHPYYTFKTIKIVKNIDIESVKAHYHNCIIDSPFEVVLAGGVKSENIESINRHLGSLKVIKKLKFSDYEFLPLKTNQTHYLEQKNALQTTTIIGTRIPQMNQKEKLIFKLGTTILGGYFGSRLMSNLREEKGYTYGIYCQANFLLKDAFFLVKGDFIKEKRKKVIEEIYKEIEKIKNKPVEDEEFKKVKNYLSGNYIKSFTTPEHFLNHFKSCLYFGLPQNYLDNYISTIQNIKPLEVQESFKKYLSGIWLNVMVG